MRKVFVTLGAIVMSLLLAACGATSTPSSASPPAAPPSDSPSTVAQPASSQSATGDAKAELEPKTLTVLTAWPGQGNKLTEALWMLKDKLEEKSDGKITLDWKGGPEAVPANQQGEAIRRGMADMALTTANYYSAQVPEALVLDYSARNPEEERQNGAIEYLSQIYEQKLGVVFLGRAPGRRYAIYTKFPVQSSADMKGRKFRGNPTYKPAFDAVGAEMLNIAPSETYTALERGLAEGLAFPTVGLADYGYQEQLKYKIQPYFWQSGSGFIMNAKTWHGLSKAQQQVIKDALVELEAEHIELMARYEEEENAKLREAGMEIVKLSDGEELVAKANVAAWEMLVNRLPDNGQKLKELFGPR